MACICLSERNRKMHSLTENGTQDKMYKWRQSRRQRCLYILSRVLSVYYRWVYFPNSFPFCRSRWVVCFFPLVCSSRSSQSPCYRRFVRTLIIQITEYMSSNRSSTFYRVHESLKVWESVIGHFEGLESLWKINNSTEVLKLCKCWLLLKLKAENTLNENN